MKIEQGCGGSVAHVSARFQLREMTCSDPLRVLCRHKPCSILREYVE